MNPTRYIRFCGIDVAKKAHVARIIDRDGNTVAKPKSFRNDAEGYRQLLQRLADAGGPRKVLVGMEATGHYWLSLHDFLTRQGYNVAVLNPIQTAQQAKKGIRTAKTDKIDTESIAVLLKNGEYRPSLVPGELAFTCRQLTRLRYFLINQGARIKQRLWSIIHPVWPEYEPIFSDPFAATGRHLLKTAPVPQDVLAIPPEALADMLRRASRGKHAAGKARQVRQAAQESVGMLRGLDAARIGIRALLSCLEALRPIRKDLEARIREIAEKLPPCILTLPGIDAIKAASLFGETDPITSFRTADQLVAFAGLDLGAWQTGQYKASQRHISKRGCPYLRKTLWHMAYRAIYEEGELRDYWLRKRSQGLKHLSAITATAIKLCRVCWRILTDQRDYVPEGPPTRSVVSAKS
ncbi:MAG: IS110 family RNA-guided transposase [Planctomycetota bacterium]|jgi:transposase